MFTLEDKIAVDKIFDLEQSIMQCWNVTDDIKLLTTRLYDGPKPLTEDEIGNVLIGLESLYQMKFDKLWSEFEDICKDYHKYRKAYEEMQASKDDGK